MVCRSGCAFRSVRRKKTRRSSRRSKTSSRPPERFDHDPVCHSCRRIFLVTALAAFSFNKLVIFGVGLIGGSLARALRERGDLAGARTVIGVGRSEASTARALEL